MLLQSDGISSSDALKPSHRLPRHRDEDQVQLDVNRSFVYYPNGQFTSCTDDPVIMTNC